ncbi:hypothetical protein F4805DRAFT_455620 [Annulohypoxylon moriforme]|nr:hypothetical protein F4805DRAFT_455620 [Annulohypoxylon moriforme]
MAVQQWNPNDDYTCCITEQRCRLCSFGIRDGDLISLGPRFHAIPGLGVFPFHRGERMFHRRVTLCCCCDQFCNQRTVSLYCFHADCLVFAQNTLNILDVSPLFLSGTRFSFQTPVWGMVEKEREARLRYHLVEKFKKEYASLKALPIETWNIIASNFVRECAIVTAHEQTRAPQTKGSLVSLARDVYAEYTTFDGTRYLKSVRNADDPNGHGNALIFRGQELGSVHEVYAVDDQFGIRDVIFVTDKKRQLSQLGRIPLGAWIRRISSPLGVETVGFDTDGFKVRGFDTIQYRHEYGQGYDFQRIARFQHVLKPSGTIINIRTLLTQFGGVRRSLSAPEEFLRMTSFDCNASYVIGYSAAISKDGVVAIFAHGSGSDLSMYGEVNPLFPVTWIYMPVDKGEIVTEICRYIRNTPVYPGRFGLTFTTNRERTGVFGSYFTLMENTDFQRVHAPPPQPSKIFFDQGNVITAMGFQDAKFPEKREIPQSAKPKTNFDMSPLDWYYSSCRMEGVTRIIPCHKKDANPEQLVGMLLEYDDGHKERMGEWRFDWAGEPMRILDREGYLRVKHVDCGHGNHQVLNIQQCEVWDLELVSSETAPIDRNYYDKYIDMPWYGTLEWWFFDLPVWLEHSHVDWEMTREVQVQPRVNVVEELQAEIDREYTWDAWFHDKSGPQWYEPDDELDTNSDEESGEESDAEPEGEADEKPNADSDAKSD